MSTRWHDDIVYLAVMAALYMIALAIYLVAKRHRRRDSGDALFKNIERWVDGTFAAALVGALVFVTIRYS